MLAEEAWRRCSWRSSAWRRRIGVEEAVSLALAVLVGTEEAMWVMLIGIGGLGAVDFLGEKCCCRVENAGRDRFGTSEVEGRVGLRRWVGCLGPDGWGCVGTANGALRLAVR